LNRTQGTKKNKQTDIKTKIKLTDWGVAWAAAKLSFMKLTQACKRLQAFDCTRDRRFEHLI